MAGEGGQEPPQIRVADNTIEISSADEGYQTPGETGGSGWRGDYSCRVRGKLDGGKDCVR